MITKNSQTSKKICNRQNSENEALIDKENIQMCILKIREISVFSNEFHVTSPNIRKNEEQKILLLFGKSICI